MKYSDRVYKNVCEYLGLVDNVPVRTMIIDEMPTKDVLNAFLTWEGILGYTHIIYDLCFPDEADELAQLLEDMEPDTTSLS
jgi:hypothetical protein